MPKYIKKMKLGKKLLFSFILVAVLGSISGIVASSALKYVDNEYGDALRDYGFSQGDIGHAMLYISQGQGDVVKIVSYTNQSEIAIAKSDESDCVRLYQALRERIIETLKDSTEKEIYSRIDAMGSEYLTVRDRVVEQGDTVDITKSLEAQDMLERELVPVYEKFYGAWQELAEYKSAKGNEESVRLTKLGNMMLTFSNVLILIVFFLAVVLGIRLSRTIAAPVRKSAERLIKFSKGDFSSPMPEAIYEDETKEVIDASSEAIEKLNRVIQDIDYQLSEMGRGNFNVTSKDSEAYVGDLSSVLQSIREVNGAVNEVLLQVDAAVAQVNMGGEQVSSGAQALAQGATEQASSVEQLAATINEISNQVNNTARNAKTAEEENRIAEQELENCSSRMDELVSAMQVIDGKSVEISKVIKTIEDIAFQTNILALNAAVEAARAGSAGKGFAVVADEVRNLATKSQDAAQSTTTLIDETVKAVAEGTRLSGETEESLRKVVENSRKVLDAVTVISSATDEQANAVSQVSTGIDQISSVVQTNSATAEESAAASEELSGQANLLKSLLDKFTLRRSGPEFPSRHAGESSREHGFAGHGYAGKY